MRNLSISFYNLPKFKIKLPNDDDFPNYKFLLSGTKKAFSLIINHKNILKNELKRLEIKQKSFLKENNSK